MIHVAEGFAARLLGVTIADVRLAAARLFTAAALNGNDREPAAKLVGERVVSVGALRTKIPVYMFSARGQRNLDAWPSVAFEIVDCDPDTSRWLPPEHEIRSEVPGFEASVSADWREDVTGPSVLAVRPHPQPFRVSIDVRLLAADHDLLLMQWLAEQLPMRSYLTVEYADGTQRLEDMQGRGFAKMFAGGTDEAPLDDVEQRGIEWVASYEVETFIDNTRDVRRTRTVTTFPEANLTPTEDP